MSDFVLPLPKKETLFEQVSQLLADKIRRGEWRPGEMLPNEAELAASFGVSQGTVRRAMQILVSEGIVIRRQGRGSFVAEFSAEQRRVMERFVRLEADDPAFAAVATGAELLEFKTMLPPETVRETLRLPAGAMVIHAARVLMSGKEPVTFDDIWLPQTDFAKLTAESLMHHPEKLLYAFYQRECGVTIVSSEETARAVLLDPDLCRRFGLPEPMPVIEVRRCSRTLGGRPVECRLQRSITRHYHYRIS